MKIQVIVSSDFSMENSKTFQDIREDIFAIYIVVKKNYHIKHPFNFRRNSLQNLSVP